MSVSTAFAEKIFYIFIDNNGKTHIQDYVPAEFKKNGYRVVNESGITLKEVPPQKNNSSRNESINAARQAEQDRILLHTYNNERELIIARDSKIHSIENIIDSTQANIDSTWRTLRIMVERKKELESAEQPVPEKLTNDIAMLSQRVDKNNRYIETQRVEQQKITAEYDAYIKRFRELTSSR